MTRMKRLARLASNVLTLLATLVFAGLAIGPHTGAYRTLTVLSGSMSPGIPSGSVVAVVPIDPSELTEGMVITYAIPVEDKRVVTHRVIDIIKDGKQPIVQTKGDANDVQDGWIAQLDGGPVWTHRATIPYLGFGINFMRQPAVRKATVIATPLIFLLVTLAQIWSGGAAAERPAAGTARRRRQRERRARPAEAWLVCDTFPRKRSRLAGVAVQGGVVVLVMTAVVSVTLVTARPAIGLFRSTVGAQQSIATAQLSPPTGVAAACSASRGSVTLTWTPVDTGSTTGYEVLRSTGGAYSPLATVTGGSANTYTDAAVVRNTTYTYQVRSLRSSWFSDASPATASVTFGGNAKC